MNLFSEILPVQFPQLSEDKAMSKLCIVSSNNDEVQTVKMWYRDPGM